MLSKFEKGKKYVFKKELLLETIKDSFDEELRNIVLGGWADAINGKVVDVINSNGGHACFYSVIPEWCEEITDGVDR